MALFSWSDKFSVQVREIDEEHKTLVGLLCGLNDAMREGKGKEALGSILEDLVQYTKKHFANEERIMRVNGYPDYAQHKAIHDYMTQRVSEIYKEHQEGKTRMTFEVMIFLQKWVEKHIMGTDKLYGPFLNSKGIS
jgi:hemerythrin